MGRLGLKVVGVFIPLVCFIVEKGSIRLNCRPISCLSQQCHRVSNQSGTVKETGTHQFVLFEEQCSLTGGQKNQYIKHRRISEIPTVTLLQ